MSTHEIIEASPGKGCEVIEASPGTKFVQKSQDLIDNLRKELQRVPPMEQEENAQDAAASAPSTDSNGLFTRVQSEKFEDQDTQLLDAVAAAEAECAQADERAAEARKKEILRLQLAKEEEDARIHRLKVEATRVNEHIQEVTNKRNAALAAQAEKHRLTKEIEEQARTDLPELTVGASPTWKNQSELEDTAARVQTIAEDLAAQLRTSEAVPANRVVKRVPARSRSPPKAVEESRASTRGPSGTDEVAARADEGKDPAAPPVHSFSESQLANLRSRFPEATDDDIVKAMTKHDGHAGRAAGDLLKKVKGRSLSNRSKVKLEKQTSSDELDPLNTGMIADTPQAQAISAEGLAAFHAMKGEDTKVPVVEAVFANGDGTTTASSLTAPVNSDEKWEGHDSRSSEVKVAEIREQLSDRVPPSTSRSEAEAAPRLPLEFTEKRSQCVLDMGATPSRPAAPPSTPLSVRSLSGISTHAESWDSDALMGLSTPHGSSELTTPLQSNSLAASSAPTPPSEKNEEFAPVSEVQPKVICADLETEHKITAGEEAVLNGAAEGLSEMALNEAVEDIKLETAELKTETVTKTRFVEDEATSPLRSLPELKTCAAEEDVERLAMAEEEARLEAEREADEERLDAERVEQEILTAKKNVEDEARLEAERKAEEEWREKRRKERLLEAQRVEQELLAEKKKAEEDRLQAERKAEEERLGAQRMEQELLAAKKKAEEEARLEAERTAQEARLLAEKVGQKLLATKRAEEEETQRKIEVARVQQVISVAKKKAEEEALLEAEKRATDQRLEAEKVEREYLTAQKKAEEGAQLEAERKTEEFLQLERVEQELLAAKQRAAEKEAERLEFPAKQDQHEKTLLASTANGTNYQDALSQYWSDAGFESPQPISANQRNAARFEYDLEIADVAGLAEVVRSVSQCG